MELRQEYILDFDTNKLALLESKIDLNYVKNAILELYTNKDIPLSTSEISINELVKTILTIENLTITTLDKPELKSCSASLVLQIIIRAIVKYINNALAAIIIDKLEAKDQTIKVQKLEILDLHRELLATQKN